jgi:hypothetical protein
MMDLLHEREFVDAGMMASEGRLQWWLDGGRCGSGDGHLLEP